MGHTQHPGWLRVQGLNELVVAVATGNMEGTAGKATVGCASKDRGITGGIGSPFSNDMGLCCIMIESVNESKCHAVPPTTVYSLLERNDSVDFIEADREAIAAVDGDVAAEIPDGDKGSVGGVGTGGTVVKDDVPEGA